MFFYYAISFSVATNSMQPVKCQVFTSAGSIGIIFVRSKVPLPDLTDSFHKVNSLILFESIFSSVLFELQIFYSLWLNVSQMSTVRLKLNQCYFLKVNWVCTSDFWNKKFNSSKMLLTDVIQNRLVNARLINFQDTQRQSWKRLK